MKFYIKDKDETRNIEVIDIDTGVEVTGDIFDVSYDCVYDEDNDTYITDNFIVDVNEWEIDYKGLAVYIDDKLMCYDGEIIEP